MISPETRAEVHKMKAAGMTHRQISEALGVGVGTVSAIGNEATSAFSPEEDERNGNERTVKKIVYKRIKTLKELAEVCEIDTTEWEIYKWKCTAWQTGMKPPTVGKTPVWERKSDKPIYSQQFSVSAWMRLKTNVIAAKNEIEILRKESLKYAPKYVPFAHKHQSLSGNMLEISLYDHHFGALIWGKETGSADYDSKIAKECWEKALSALVARTQGTKFDRVLFVLGNDQQNIDNRAGTTEAGTPQHSDGRYQKMFAVSRDASRWAIDQLSTVAPNVDVVIVPGNHDYLSAFHLGDTLQSWYHRAPNVKIDNTPAFRKYYQYGRTMLGFTHGNKGKLEDYDRTMAAEQPIMWGETAFREMHTGDKHRRFVVELKGATVRILPSLRPPCSWSAENHFIGAVRAAEAFVWNKDEGLIGSAFYSIL